METSVLKDKIHTLIDSSDEDTLQSVYQLLQEADYTDEFKNVLNEEQAEYYESKEVVNKEAMDELIRAALKK